MCPKWFQKAIKAKPPYNLGGWSKKHSTLTRRKLALESRSQMQSLGDKRLSAARALQALANVTKDRATKAKARADAKYFFKKK
jgi:hypothetical protein